MYINSYGRLCSDDYLAHHGILGQKHGVRNGPPYPLDAKAHSASERKAGWRDSLKGNESRSERKVIKYRFKETQKSNKKHDKLIRRLDKKIDKGQQKLENLESKGKTSKRLEKKIDEYSRLRARRKVMKAIESEQIKNMTLKDIRKEKLTVAARRAEYVLRNGILAALPSANLAVSVASSINDTYEMVGRRSVSGYKTASRIKQFAKNGGNVEKYAKKEGLSVKDYKDLLPHRGGNLEPINYATKRKFR